IGTVTYTFIETALSDPAVPYEVLVGVSDSVSLDNLIAAINADAGEGTVYGTGTVANPHVSAAAGAGDTMVVTALVADGVATATTATLTAGDWGAATLAGSILASGATGRIVEATDAGTTGVLQLRDVRGEFTNNELITDSSTGSALANGTLTTPLLTPSDAIILQADAEDFSRSELSDAIALLEAKLIEMDWKPDNGFFALRVTRGALADQVEHLGLLAYDGQSGNFAADLVVTGGTSGATGRIVTDTDGGSDGTLLLADVRGIFENNEAITDSATGAAVANGAQTVPLLTPADQLILQIDAVDYTKAEALEGLKQLELAMLDMAWPAAA
ncbi:MAG TPA: hypothetical protein VM756_04205, partial [Burkholderiales bacterium]|nr:hypothetical protein [Burkholderiales bacterium]